MSFDPFASAPADDEAQSEPTYSGPPASQDAFEQPQAEPVVAVEHAAVTEIVTTFKGDGQAPWVVVHSQTVEESDALLNESFANYLKKVKKVAEFFAGGSTIRANTSPRQSAPQGATQAPDWFPPAPAPGWVYKTGFKKDGSGAWHAWAPAQKGGGEWQFHNPPRK